MKIWENIYEHSQDHELHPELKAEIGSVKCDFCGRLFGEHSSDEFSVCLAKLGKQKKVDDKP
jgi:hypothetical protein